MNNTSFQELEKIAKRAKESFGEIVYFDVGARDGLISTWDSLAKTSYIQAYGFDPAKDHISSLSDRDNHVKYFPFALGERHERKRLIHTFMPGCSSFLEPNFELLKNYPAHKIFEVVGESEVEVHALDDLIASGKVPQPHILKIDTQGFELPILKGCSSTLSNVVCIELETQFKEMYKTQALFPEVKAFLEEHGFILRQLLVNGPYEGEFLEADAYFSKRPSLNDNIDVIRLWQTACGISSPKFLSQMDDWLPEWKVYLTEDQTELRNRLFGPL
ncbi:MAG: FkbM family methyltransferase [Alphaproteobacteria bacterium]|nr:FkbM family methyltransferase [Alphaproteobacteria bacterium]